MNYTIIAFLLFVAVTYSTARSIDALEEKVQEIREETPSSSEDAPFSLPANEDEEARITWQNFLETMKKISHRIIGREESLPENVDEEARFLLKAILAKRNNMGREESLPLNADEEARITWQNFLETMKKISHRIIGREESLPENVDEEARFLLKAILAKRNKMGREESLPLNADEEARITWQNFLETVKKISHRIIGREESLPENVDEEARLGLISLPAKWKQMAEKKGREENEYEKARLSWAEFVAKMNQITQKVIGREESLPENEDEEARFTLMDLDSRELSGNRH